jgi:hypothetical protein
MDETKKQLLQAFYSVDPSLASPSSDEPSEHRHYDAELCLSNIKHTISSDPLLQGTIENLQVLEVPLEEAEIVQLDEDIANEPRECSDQADTYFNGEDPFEDEELEEQQTISDSETNINKWMMMKVISKFCKVRSVCSQSAKTMTRQFNALFSCFQSIRNSVFARQTKKSYFNFFLFSEFF